MNGNDPDETTPFTHRPYGSRPEEPQEPTSPPPPPSGEQGEQTWETYQQPGEQAPQQPDGQPPYGQPPYVQPSYGQAPYGEPSYEQPSYGQPPYGASAYGQSPYAGYGQTPHPEATTALIMGIVALAGTFVCGFLCVVGPFAWAKGAKVRREIDADPQRWSGRGEATAGFVMGIITTMLMLLGALALFLVFAVYAGT